MWSAGGCCIAPTRLIARLTASFAAVEEGHTNGAREEREIALQSAGTGDLWIDRPLVIRDGVRVGEIVDERLHLQRPENHAAACGCKIGGGERIVGRIELQRAGILAGSAPFGRTLIFIVDPNERVPLEQCELVFESDRGGDRWPRLAALADDGVAVRDDRRGLGGR